MDAVATRRRLAWRHPLFPFQEVGVDRLVDRDAVLLADEMGLGKTIQAIAALRLLAADGSLAGALIVAPAGLVTQWRRQLRDWAPELTLSTVVGPAHEREDAWAAPATIHIVGYESLRSDMGLRRPYGPSVRHWGVVVLDEAQRIKDAEADLSRSVKTLRRSRSWALTGTPLENRLDDMISLLDFVAPGRFSPAGMAVGLRALLAEVQLRRRRRDVLHDLPPKLVTIVACELAGRQKQAYVRLEREGLMRIEALGRDVTVTDILTLILRLKQVCNVCPETGQSAKLADLRERLRNVVAAGEKALVFSQYVDDTFGLRRLARELAEFRPLTFSGELDQGTRGARLATFERDADRPVLLLSLKAGGVGLNLTSASHVFHFDRWWNPATEAQAEDRAHRIGQQRPVHVYAYLCRDTIEERVQAVLAEKQALFSDVVDGETSGLLRRLDLDALMEALRPT